jgi:hypothetical protein
MVAYICNPSTGELEAEGSGVQGKSVSQKKRKEITAEDLHELLDLPNSV